MHMFPHASKYNAFLKQIHIKIRDMRVDFYTLEHRNLGQAEGAHKVGASERCSQNPAAAVADRNACISCRERSDVESVSDKKRRPYKVQPSKHKFLKTRSVFIIKSP